MNDEFYRAFEERHRGTRDLILARLAVYLPFITTFKSIYPSCHALDLGCGRGEWIELLLKEGFSPLGIDRDAIMLQECLDLNLPAQMGDAIQYLTSVADNSQTIVSAFHLVEHLDFDQIRIIVAESLRVLKPGGLLIMETPNPENILVATNEFYLDPTHKRPIPPQLLSFLPEYYGFFRTKILRLQESKTLINNESISLQNVLDGASPDYAVIAQKAASVEIHELFNDLFRQEYGLSIKTLTTGFDNRLQSNEAKALQATERSIQAENTARQTVERAAQSEFTAQQATDRTAQTETTVRQTIERVTYAESTAKNAAELAAQAVSKAKDVAERTSQAELSAQNAAEEAAQAVSKAKDVAERVARTESTAQNLAEQVAQADAMARHAADQAVYAVSISQHASEQSDQAETTALHAAERAARAEETALHAAERAARAEETALHNTERVSQAEATARRAAEYIVETESTAQQAVQALHAIYTSYSWRITYPLRWCGTQIILLRQSGLRARLSLLINRFFKCICLKIFSFIDTKPTLRTRCIRAAEMFGVYETIESIYQKYSGGNHSHKVSLSNNNIISDNQLTNLTTWERRIYENLIKAIYKNKGS